MKVIRFNKERSKTVNVENAHQGCFATNQLFRHYQELMNLIIGFNTESKDVQIQLIFFLVEDFFMATVRLVTTNCKLIVDYQADALFRSLKYLKSKRSNSQKSFKQQLTKHSRSKTRTTF